MIDETALPETFTDWFADRHWAPHPHQMDMVAAGRAGHSALLIAPTGGGKTLAGFLPSLTDISEAGGHEGLHTLYISPLKALAVDIHRNLETPVREMDLPVTMETRTGDTPQAKRQRQRREPPNILLTTPESFALLISYPEAGDLFGGLKTVVIDELHALAGTKRGDLLALGLARLKDLAPGHRRVGLSATVAYPDALIAYLSKTGQPEGGDVTVVTGGGAKESDVKILIAPGPMPWSGHMGLHTMPQVYEAIREHGTTIVFVNTRAQAELCFAELWRLNEEALPIGLHHGSLDREQRRRVEGAMARGDLRAVVATASLDLGIDWAAVDLVVQIGAPKGASRLIQRIGRSNHRLDAPSKALLVPANRFEVLECKAALDAIKAGTLDGQPPGPGGLDVLAQHLVGVACSGPFHPDALYDEVTTAAPYRDLDRRDFDDVLAFVDHGGYALTAYERYHRLAKMPDGRFRIAHPNHARRYRMNIGTIVEEATYKVLLSGKRGMGGKPLGEVEEYFIQMLTPGDTFLFAGQLLEYIGLRDNKVLAGKGKGSEPKIPAYAGGRMPLTTHLADRVRGLLSGDQDWPTLPGPVEEWLRLQQWRSVMPGENDLLVETFPRGNKGAHKEFLVAYCFEGRNAHQTLGMLLTKRMERMGYRPLGFVATDYVIAVWSLRPATDIDALFDVDLLGDDLEAWMDESSLLRRTFKRVAVIAGLIDRRAPGQEKSGRQVVVSTDLIYDTLRRYEPDHVLLRATRADAAQGLCDLGRLAGLLERVQGKIHHRRLDRVSPLAVPVLLEVGREQVQGSALDDLLDEAAEDLIREATEMPDQGALPI
ncbi:MAG: ligase-associated DNA damage response DEXH box helicase [Alphaproteobacteria bacterium]|nr:ligase-associated DNA damage response DEXH box helicase [Alphaproteobacteria bacterium]